MRVESEPGKGSSFEVYLPHAGSAPDETASPAGSPEIPRGAATILLVEDDLEVRTLMHDILVGVGYNVLVSGNAAEAILAAKNHPGLIDLLVSDIVMPGLAGPELAQRLTEIRPNMKVLYVSGYADHETAARALGDPEVEYLQKPFGPAELAAKVAEITSRPKDSSADSALN
jgi:DNA-binding NtrC family response regulator